ncbi:MAG: phosphonate ABC transporter, permease protein PhnE [Deltaproteobacteria bacterium]|nr:phosphonate ABC transporter, permease protein PhnE [Deltaproteobacteria bacterium]
MNPSSIQIRLERVVALRKRYKAIRYFFYFILFLLVLYSIKITVIEDTDWERIGGLGMVAKAMGRFLPPDLSVVKYLFKPTVETFMIACLGTMLAVVLSIPVIWLGAHNITPFFAVTYPLGRSLMTLSRSVNEIVWALIFVAAVGLGAFPGILAIAMRSVGFVAKTTAEAIEDVNTGPIEAIKAVGGSRFQVIRYAILPQILPIFISLVIFQWDINIRRATITGLVGAGGLGLTIQRQLLMYNYGGVTTVILAMLVLIGIGEVVSYYARRAII